jgi:serine/threonine protein phosphatase PrpC
VVSGTTVVVLLTQGATGICLWAGDSRLYRLREGTLEQISVDHSEEEEGTGDDGMPRRANVITRAVGGREELELDQLSFDIKLGDRLLLCSDGLYRELSPEQIAEMLQNGDAMSAVETLQLRVLRGEAADNVTVIVIDAQPEAD